MVDTSRLAILKELQLTDYEARIYLALLEKKTLTVTEVSKIANVPRANAYEALEKLLAKGLCILKPGKTKQYSASDPSLLREKIYTKINEKFENELGKLDKKRKEIIGRREATLQNMDHLIEELAPLYCSGQSNENPLEYIEVLKDPLLVHRRLIQLSEGAKSEILGFSKPPYSNRQLLHEQTDQQNKLLKRGVRLRAIYEIPVDEGEKRELFHTIEAVTRRGEESRVIETLPLKMMIFDERIVLFAMVDPVFREASLTSLVIDHQNLARTLKIVFETLWQQAEDYHVLAVEMDEVKVD